MRGELWNAGLGARWVQEQERLDTVLAPYAEALRQDATLDGDGVIVDVGCGCGATTLMARRASPRARVIGIDISEPMLRAAQQRADAQVQAGAPIELVRADASSTVLPAATVDRVISRFGVMFFDDPLRAFCHMRGWLKPEARLSAVVWGPAAHNPWLSELVKVMADHVRVPPLKPGAPGPFALSEAADRDALFRRAGFRLHEEDLLDRPLEIRGTVDEVVAFYLGRGPIAAALEVASEHARHAATDALRARIERLHDGDGVRLSSSAVRIRLCA